MAGQASWFLVSGAVLALALAGCPSDKTRPIDDNEGGAEKPWNPHGNGGTDVGTRPPVTRLTCPPYCPPPAPGTLQRSPAPNPIPAENAKPGDPDWRDGLSSWSGEVEVYADHESLFAGERLGVKVSTSTASTVSATVYRIGWYGGAGARKVWSGGPWSTSKQSACTRDGKTGLVECDWKDTFSFDVDPSWPSGFYVIKVMRVDGYKRFYPFVVRDRRAAEILYTPNFTTYQAYNTWGGESLYFDGAGIMPSGKAWQVSFDRPYEATDGGGKTFNLDVYFVSFLERYGYDVTYGTQLDFVRFADVLDGIGAFVIGGQEEYWPSQERAQVDQALASGKTSLAYFGGNGGYWRIRLLSDGHGSPLRTIACYKSDVSSDPEPGSTVRYRDEPNAQPEQNLFGVMYEGWQLIPFPMIVGDTSHWLYEGTGLTPGTRLNALVGFEYDRAFPEWAGYPSGVHVLTTSPVVSGEGIPSFTQSVERTLPNGRLVFSAGTIWWPLALSDDPELRDDRVARMTLNVIERALSHRRAARTFPAVTSGFPSEPAPNPVWAQSVAAFVGVVGQPGYQDGPANAARFSSPTGLAVLATGELVIADTGNNRVRLVSADASHTVTTIAGNGDLGYRDGEGSQAMFRAPTGVAVGPAGEIYVADSDNHTIRRIDRGPSGWTVSTVAGVGFSAGYSDGVGTAAKFNRPLSLDVDSAGHLYVADTANNVIRMITLATREVTTVAGSGAFGADDDPVGRRATFNNPTSVAVGNAGELYVMDAGSQLIRRVAPTGTRAVTTVAGNRDTWFGFADGAGHVARFSAQMGMDVGAGGELIVADTANFRIRKVVSGATPEATQVYTIAGSGMVGTRLGNGATADIVAPAGLTFGINERIYVSDSFHHVIREITR
ncbi:MAG: hypothetical protein IRZ16_23155 [Myxococcaceae bacterium]|nr:hypothetical protein [Myxococcaceae bacterium]